MRPIEFRNKLSFAITPEHHAHSCGGALHAPLLLLLGFAGAIAANPIYGAQDYPTRPVRVVVPFAAGGGSGAMAQIVTQKLTEALGQPAVMDYRSGAGGRVGTESVARSAPDGYTLLLTGSGAIVLAAALYDKLPYDPQKDLAPITTVATNMYMLVVHPAVPARSVKQLIALAKSTPGRLNYASSGYGAPAHLAAELFQALTKLRMVHVAYKGSGPGTTSVMIGETDLMFSNILPAVPAVKSGRLRAIAVTGLQRSSVFPGIPTVDESGVRGFETVTHYGVFAPAGTPVNIITRLNTVLVKSLQSAETRKLLQAVGSELRTSTPRDFASMIKSDTEKWTGIVKAAGIKPNQR